MLQSQCLPHIAVPSKERVQRYSAAACNRRTERDFTGHATRNINADICGTRNKPVRRQVDLSGGYSPYDEAVAHLHGAYRSLVNTPRSWSFTKARKRLLLRVVRLSAEFCRSRCKLRWPSISFDVPKEIELQVSEACGTMKGRSLSRLESEMYV